MGIDPGQNGGVAILEVCNGRTQVAHAEKLPLLVKQLNTPAFIELIATWNPAGICIEQQAGRFSTPNTYYQAIGVIETCNYYGFSKARIVNPNPARWHSAMFGRVPKGKTKEFAELRCRQLFPEFCANKTKLHDGIVDAIILAQYGINTLQDSGTSR
jgi:hypothetical protein